MKQFTKKVITALVVAALAMVTALPAMAANPNKTATLSLNAAGSSAYGVIRKNDTVKVTATVSDMAQTFKNGIHGFTMDVTYDSAKFIYMDFTKNLSAGNFILDVYDSETVPGRLSVLLYPNDESVPFSAFSGNTSLFTLNFKVTSDTAASCAFTPNECNFADRKDSDDGFEMITLTPAPAAKTVALKALKAGDINGNDKVDVIDLIALKKHIAGDKVLTGGDLLAADGINQTGETIDADDLVWMRRELLGLNL